MSETEKE